MVVASFGNLSILLFVLGLDLRLLSGQPLPTRNEELRELHGHYPEISIDTGRLFDGTEMQKYVYRGRQSVFHFMPAEDGVPLTLRATPCSSPIQVNVTYKDESAEIPSGDYGMDDVLDQQMTSSAPGGKASRRHGSVAELSGRGALEYHTDSAAAGWYRIVIEAVVSDTSVRLYASTSPHNIDPHPTLPANDQVKVSVDRRSMTVAWKASPSETQHRLLVEYCVALSRRTHFETMCAVTSKTEGDLPPPLPKHVGYGFKNERERMLVNRKGEYPPSKARPGEIDFVCVGSKTSYTFADLMPGQRYVIDVFAVDKATNASSTYRGTSMKTKDGKKTIRLKNGKLLFAHIKRSQSAKFFQYELRKDSKELIFGVEPCGCEIDVEISRNGSIQIEAYVNSLRIFTLNNAKEGSYIVRVYHPRRESVTFNVFVATRSSSIPFPKLPKNHISVRREMGTCDSVRLSWAGTRSRQTYCLYMKRLYLPRDRLVSLFQRPNTCIDPRRRKDMRKIVCRKFRARKKRKRLTETVAGLTPNSTYIFTVYVKKFRSRGLPYRPIIYSTKSTC